MILATPTRSELHFDIDEAVRKLAATSFSVGSGVARYLTDRISVNARILSGLVPTSSVSGISDVFMDASAATFVDFEIASIDLEIEGLLMIAEAGCFPDDFSDHALSLSNSIATIIKSQR